MSFSQTVILGTHDEIACLIKKIHIFRRSNTIFPVLDYFNTFEYILPF